MNKYMKYYFISSLFIIASLFVFFYIRVPHTEYSAVNLSMWNTDDFYAGDYSSEDELYIYTNIDQVSDVIFIGNEFLQFFDSDRVLLFSIQISNLEFPNSQPSYDNLSTGEHITLDGYNLLGRIRFQEGYYNMNINYNYLYDVNPFITTTEPVVKTVIDYSDYTIVPILIGFMGILFLIMTYLSNRKEYGDLRYQQGNHYSTSKKRERY